MPSRLQGCSRQGARTKVVWAVNNDGSCRRASFPRVMVVDGGTRGLARNGRVTPAAIIFFYVQPEVTRSCHSRYTSAGGSSPRGGGARRVVASWSHQGGGVADYAVVGGGPGACSVRAGRPHRSCASRFITFVSFCGVSAARFRGWHHITGAGGPYMNCAFHRQLAICGWRPGGGASSWRFNCVPWPQRAILPCR
jgi:hypothetical protein